MYIIRHQEHRNINAKLNIQLRNFDITYIHMHMYSVLFKLHEDIALYS